MVKKVDKEEKCTRCNESASFQVPGSIRGKPIDIHLCKNHFEEAIENEMPEVLERIIMPIRRFLNAWSVDDDEAHRVQLKKQIFDLLDKENL